MENSTRGSRGSPAVSDPGNGLASGEKLQCVLGCRIELTAGGERTRGKLLLMGHGGAKFAGRREVSRQVSARGEPG